MPRRSRAIWACWCAREATPSRGWRLSTSSRRRSTSSAWPRWDGPRPGCGRGREEDSAAGRREPAAGEPDGAGLEQREQRREGLELAQPRLLDDLAHGPPAVHERIDLLGLG